MSDTHHFKELFLQLLVADEIASVPRWVYKFNFCPIQVLDKVRSGGRAPTVNLVKRYNQVSDQLIWSYCSLTPFCGIYFARVEYLTYEANGKIAIICRSRELDGNVPESATVKADAEGSIASAQIQIDIHRDINDAVTASVIARSLGFATWPKRPLLELHDKAIRPTFEAAVLIGMLYDPELAPGLPCREITPLLDSLVSRATDRAEANRGFLNRDQYLAEARPFILSSWTRDVPPSSRR